MGGRFSTDGGDPGEFARRVDGCSLCICTFAPTQQPWGLFDRWRRGKQCGEQRHVHPRGTRCPLPFICYHEKTSRDRTGCRFYCWESLDDWPDLCEPRLLRNHIGSCLPRAGYGHGHRDSIDCKKGLPHVQPARFPSRR